MLVLGFVLLIAGFALGVGALVLGTLSSSSRGETLGSFGVAIVFLALSAGGYALIDSQREQAAGRDLARFRARELAYYRQQGKFTRAVKLDLALPARYQVLEISGDGRRALLQVEHAGATRQLRITAP